MGVQGLGQRRLAQTLLFCPRPQYLLPQGNLPVAGLSRRRGSYEEAEGQGPGAHPLSPRTPPVARRGRRVQSPETAWCSSHRLQRTGRCQKTVGQARRLLVGWARGVANCGLIGRPLQRGSEGAVSRQGHQQGRERSEISRHRL